VPKRFMVRRFCTYAPLARVDVISHESFNLWPEVPALDELDGLVDS
jgi:hypothetical protein